jgi:class 3 adenylate cyclase
MCDGRTWTGVPVRITRRLQLISLSVLYVLFSESVVSLVHERMQRDSPEFLSRCPSSARRSPISV